MRSTTTGAFAIPAFQARGLTFSQAALTEVDGAGCFQFGTAGASLSATSFSCGASAFAPDGGWQSIFPGANAPGMYTAFNAAPNGSTPAAPDELTIAAEPVPEMASTAMLAGGLAFLAAVIITAGESGSRETVPSASLEFPHDFVFRHS